MGYTRAFGMRSFENIVRDGRFRVPRTGTPLQIGSPVMLDQATPGFLTVAGAAQAPGPHCGIVVFEHIHKFGVDASLASVNDAPFDVVPLGQYAQMIHGPGAKVWFKNVPARTLYDGRAITGWSPVTGDISTFQPGVTGLVPSADGRWAVAGAGQTAWLVVEQSNPSTAVVEARFAF